MGYSTARAVAFLLPAGQERHNRRIECLCCPKKSELEFGTGPASEDDRAGVTERMTLPRTCAGIGLAGKILPALVTTFRFRCDFGFGSKDRFAELAVRL